MFCIINQKYIHPAQFYTLEAYGLWLKQTVDKIKTVKYYFCAGNISVLRSSCAGNEGRTFEINSLIVSRIRGFYRIFLRIRGEFVPKLYITVSICAKGGGGGVQTGLAHLRCETMKKHSGLRLLFLGCPLYPEQFF